MLRKLSRHVTDLELHKASYVDVNAIVNARNLRRLCIYGCNVGVGDLVRLISSAPHLTHLCLSPADWTPQFLAELAKGPPLSMLLRALYLCYEFVVLE